MHASRLLAPAVACALLLPAAAVRGQPQPDPDDVAKAKELLASGHPEQALALLDPVIDAAMQGDAKDKAAICPGDAAAFLAGFIKAPVTITARNDWCEALLAKGYALNELKRPAEAAEVLRVLVDHAPRNAHYLIEYAYTVRVNGDVQRALGLYRQAGRIAANHPERPDATHWRAAALRGEGYTLGELQRWDEATKAYQRSLEYEPDSEIARNELRYIESRRPR